MRGTRGVAYGFRPRLEGIYAIDAHFAGHFHGGGVAVGDAELFLPGARGEKNRALDGDGCGFEGLPLPGVQRGELIGMRDDGAAAVSVGGGDDVANV